MTENQQKAMDRLIELHINNPKYLALIICGSIATGKSRIDSDIDLYLISTDEEFQRIQKTCRLQSGSM